MDERNIVDSNSLTSEGLSVKERIYSEVRKEYCRLFGSVPSGSISELSLFMLLRYLDLHRRLGLELIFILDCPVSLEEMLIASIRATTQLCPEYFELVKTTIETTLKLQRRFPIALSTLASSFLTDTLSGEDCFQPIKQYIFRSDWRIGLDSAKADNYTSVAETVFHVMSKFPKSTDTVDIVLCAYKHVKAETIDLEATKRRLEIPQARIDFYRRDWLASERFVVARILKKQIIQEAVNVWHKTKPELVAKLLRKIVFDLDLHREHYCLEYEAVGDALYTITKKDDLYEDYLKEPFLDLVRNYGEGNEQSVTFAFHYLAKKADEEFTTIAKEADKLGEKHDYNISVRYAVQRLLNTHPERFPEEHYVEYREMIESLRCEEGHMTEEELKNAVLGKG